MESEDRKTFETDDEIDVKPMDPHQDMVRKPDLESIGVAAIFLLVSLCLPLFGLPLLLLSLLKTSESLQTMSILGLSYPKLLFIFLLSAAVIAYACMFFLKIRTSGILVFFALSVFSCFPLIVGLKNNFSLQQAILEIPFFQGWPFFLRPCYILIEFLIPAAIISCLILQMKNFLSRKPFRFTFSLVALYLGIAAFFGFSALTRAGQPNLVNILAGMYESRHQQHSRIAKTHVPAADNTGDVQPSVKNAPEDRTSRTETAYFSETGTDLGRSVQVLSDKVDRILEILTQTEPATGVQQQATARMENAEARKERNPKPKPTDAIIEDPLTNKPVIADLRSRMQTVSDKVEQILETLSRVQIAIPILQENPPDKKAITKAELVPEPHSGGQSAGQIDIQPTEKATSSKPGLEDLSQKVQALSEKMDRVVETLNKMEKFLPEKKEMPAKQIPPRKPKSAN